MRFGICLLMVMICAGLVFGQTPSPAANIPQVVWNPADRRCGSFFLEGMYVRTIRHDDILIVFAEDEFAGYLAEYVYVENIKKTRIDVLPERAALGLWKKVTEPNVAADEVLLPVDAKKIAGKIVNSQRWANAFALLGASLARQTATITNDATGDSATITMPNPQAQVNAQQQAAANSAVANSKAAIVTGSALKANTLGPGEFTDGFVYFKNKKHAERLFVIQIGMFRYSFFTKEPAKG